MKANTVPSNQGPVRPGRLLSVFAVVWTANVLALAGLALALLFGGIR